MESSDGHVDRVLRHSRAIRDETGALIAELRAAREDLERALDLKGRLERHPYATLAAAAGIGYVLGGGLFTRLTARVVSLGARAVLAPLLRAQIGALAESVLSPAPAEGDGPTRAYPGRDPGETEH